MPGQISLETIFNSFFLRNFYLGLMRRFEEVIASCRKCDFVDKPPVKFEVYKKFLPVDVRVLVISESPPGNKCDYLYNLSCRDRLRRVLAYAFQVDEPDVLRLLHANGVFWTTAVKCRPIDKSRIEPMRRSCLSIFRLEVEALKPRRIVAFGKVAQRSILDLNFSEKYKVSFHYHPLYVVRFVPSKLPEVIAEILR